MATLSIRGGSRAQFEHLEDRRLMSAVAPISASLVAHHSLSIPTGTGLKAQYFDNKDLTNLVATRVDREVNFNWANAAPIAGVSPDTFSAALGGQVLPQFSETYTFYTNSDDGVRLWVNGQLLIDQWNDHSAKEDSASIALLAGQKYDIKMEFYENGWDAVATLAWSSDSQEKQIIPQSQLFHPDVPTPVVGEGNGLTGQYFDNKDLTNLKTIRLDNQVNFNWGENVPAQGVAPDTFSARWTGQVQAQYSERYTFATTTDDGVRLWVNGQLLINQWNDHSATTDFGSIDLVAGQKYDIKMEFYENGWDAVASLGWSSDSTAQQVIPTSQLFSSASAPVDPSTNTPSDPPPVVTPPDDSNPDSPEVGNATITVDQNGPIKSIQQAANMARAGDVVLIKNGTYREGVTLNNSGNANNRITFLAQSVGGVIIDGGGTNTGINARNASYITIKGITIKNVNNGVQNENAALRVGANSYVEDVVVDRCAGAAVGVMGSNSTLVRVTASNNGQIGIGGSYVSNVLVKDCNSFGNNTRGFDPGWEGGGGKWAYTDGVVIDGGKWYNNTGPAIWFDYQNKNFTVKNTEVYGNKGLRYGFEGAGIVSEINAGPAYFLNNYVHDNQGCGLGVWESMGVTMSGNRLSNDVLEFRDLENRAPFHVYQCKVLNNTFTNGARIANSLNMNPGQYGAKQIQVSGNTGL